MAGWWVGLLVWGGVWGRLGGAVGRMRLGGGVVVVGVGVGGWGVGLGGVGGGSQVASFLAYTTIFGVEKEPAAAASIVMWLITLAASSLAGAPLLIPEGVSLRQLRERAEHYKEAAGESPAQQGEPPRRN